MHVEGKELRDTQLTYTQSLHGPKKRHAFYYCIMYYYFEARNGSSDRLCLRKSKIERFAIL